MADLLDRLRDGARFDSRGTFTLDRRKALEKMREFQLVDAHEYVLFLVQAAVAAQAPSLAFTSGSATGGSSSVWIPGLVLERSFLEEPFSGLFLSQQRRDAEPFRCLSIALNALLSLVPGTVEVESGAWACTVGTAQRALVRAQDPFVEGTRVRLNEGWMSLAVRTLGASREVERLQARAWACPIPISINGAALAGEGWREAAARRVSAEGPWLESASREAEEVRASLFVADSTARGVMTIVRNGVVLTERKLDMPLSPRVIAFADSLLTNASGSDVVEDERYEALLALVDQAADDLIAAVVRRAQADAAARARCRACLLPVVSQRFKRQKKQGKEGIASVRDSAASTALRETPLFRRLGDSLASLADIEAELGARGRVLRYTGRTPLAAMPDHLVLQPESAAETQVLDELLGGLVSELTADDPAMRRMLNLERWRRARAVPELPASGDDLEARSFNEGGFTGELRIDDEGDARLSVFVEGRYLVDRVEKLHGMSFRAAVNGRSLEPDYTFADIVPDERWKAALSFLCEQYEAACAQWLGRVGADAARAAVMAPHVRAVLEWYRASLRDPAGLPPTLRACPAFPTVSGRLASIADLERDVAEFGQVHFARSAERGSQRDHRQILADPEARLSGLLKYWFRGGKVVDYSRALAAERAIGPGAPIDLSLGGQALYPVGIERDGLKGAVGISLTAAAKSAPQPARKRKGKPVTTGPASGRCRLQIVAQGRLVETRDVEVPVGPLEAIVDSPRLTVSRPDGPLVEDEAWEEALAAVRSAVPVLAARAASRVAQGGDADWKLRAAERLVLDFLCTDQAVPNDLAQAPIFPALGKRRLSLAELRLAGNVRYVTSSTEDAGSDLEGPVVRLSGSADAGYERALRHQLGSLHDWTAAWQEQRARAAFLAQPKRSVTLDMKGAAAIVRIDREGLAGVIGLRPTLPQGACQAVVTVLREGRLLDTFTVPTLLPVEAVFSSDRFQPDRTWRALTSREGEAVRDMLQALQAGMSEAVSVAAEKARPHSGPAHLVLSWIAAARRDVLPAAARNPAVQARLDALPLLETVDGRTVAVADVSAELQKKRRLLFVRPAVRGQADGEDFVLRLDAEEERVLRTVFSPLVNFERELQLDAAARANREQRRLRGRSITEPVIAREPVEAEGMRGELAVPRSPRASVVIARDGVVLREGPLFDEVTVIGVVEGTAFEPNRTWDDVKLKKGQLDVLRDAMQRLMTTLAARVADDPNAVRPLLSYAGWCRAHGQTVDDAVASAPLFERVGGGRASLRELIGAASRDEVLYARHDGQAVDDRLVVIADAAAAAFLVEYFGQRRVREVDPPPVATMARKLIASVMELGRSALTGASKVADTVGDTIMGQVRQQAKARDEAARAVREKAALMREEQRKALKREVREASRRQRQAAEEAAADPLEAGLRACFSALPWLAGQKWPLTLLRSVRLGSARRGALLDFLDSGLVLNERHVLVARARALRLDDRETVACLASAIFTDLNRLRADVRDEDETRFMTDLADWVMAGLSSKE